MTLTNDFILAINDNEASKKTEVSRRAFSKCKNKDKMTNKLTFCSTLNKETAYDCPGTVTAVEQFDKTYTRMNRNTSFNNSSINQRPSIKSDRLFLRTKWQNRSVLSLQRVVPSLKIPGHPQKGRNPSLYQTNLEETNVMDFAEKHPGFYDPEKALSYLKSSEKDDKLIKSDSIKMANGNSFLDIPSDSRHNMSLDEILQRSSVRFSSVIEKKASHATKSKPSISMERASSHTPPTHPPTDLKIKITSAPDLIYVRDSDEKRQLNFDYFNACLVPIKQPWSRKADNAQQIKMHKKWLESNKRLGKTEETLHVDCLSAGSTNRMVFAEDSKRAFSTVRIPTARRSPAVIAWPEPRDPLTFILSKDPSRGRIKHQRDAWWLEADGNIRVENLSIGTTRFHPWSGFDNFKTRAATCYFLNRALGPPPPHQRLKPPNHILRESELKLNQLGKAETERKTRLLRETASKPSYKSSIASFNLLSSSSHSLLRSTTKLI